MTGLVPVLWMACFAKDEQSEVSDGIPWIGWPVGQFLPVDLGNTNKYRNVLIAVRLQSYSDNWVSISPLVCQVTLPNGRNATARHSVPKGTVSSAMVIPTRMSL